MRWPWTVKTEIALDQSGRALTLALEAAQVAHETLRIARRNTEAGFLLSVCVLFLGIVIFRLAKNAAARA